MGHSYDDGNTHIAKPNTKTFQCIGHIQLSRHRGALASIVYQIWCVEYDENTTVSAIGVSGSKRWPVRVSINQGKTKKK